MSASSEHSTLSIATQRKRKAFGMALFDKAKRLWVIFDTSQYPAYYRDVHDLLAAPRGFVMRYQYREELLSNTAINFGVKNHPVPILFAYAQKNSKYERQQ